MNKKYLIIGAPGWLGTRFVRAICGTIEDLRRYSDIDQVEEIRCLTLPQIDAKILENIHPKVKVYHGDITNKDSMVDFFEGTEEATLFHIAGLIHPTKGIQQVFEINYGGAKNVLELAIDHRLKRIVAVSSNSPAGVNPYKDHRFTEEDPFNPYMAYGRSKMQMEMMIQNAYEKNAIETVILRPCWFYGPDQPARQTLFFSMVKDGGFPLLGGGASYRSMSYVDNTCQGLLLAGTKDQANGKTYWIADKEAYAMHEIIETIERLLKDEFNFQVKGKQMNLPSFVGEVAWAFDWALQKVGVYHQKIHVLSEMNKTIACSVAKAEKELGYQPQISLEEGMRRSIRWCLENGQSI